VQCSNDRSVQRIIASTAVPQDDSVKKLVTEYSVAELDALLEITAYEQHSSLGNLTPQEFAEISLAKEKERVSLPADSSRNSD
jgi:hypothetical protein